MSEAAEAEEEEFPSVCAGRSACLFVFSISISRNTLFCLPSIHPSTSEQLQGFEPSCSGGCLSFSGGL